MKKLYNVKSFNELEYILYCTISKDRTNPTSKSTIYSLTGIKERLAKQLIRSLRNKGVPVCSKICNGGGYWIEDNKEEFGKFVLQQKTELEGYKKTINILCKIYHSIPGEDPNELFI